MIKTRLISSKNYTYKDVCHIAVSNLCLTVWV